jgi:GT2 family glycosyltransferase
MPAPGKSRREAAQRPFFVLVDADDVLAARFIEKTAVALRANPDLHAVATWTEFFGDYQGVEAKPPFDARVGRRENPIVSTCLLVDMAVRDRGIRFASDLAFIYCEDWDFWAQIFAAGGRFGLVPEPLVRHRVHKTSGANARTDVALRIGKARATSRLSVPSMDLFR